MLKAIAQKETILEHSHHASIDFFTTQMKEIDENLVKLIQLSKPNMKVNPSHKRKTFTKS